MLFEQGNEGLKERGELLDGHHGNLIVVEQSLAKQRVCALLAGVGFEHAVHAKALARRAEKGQQRHCEGSDQQETVATLRISDSRGGQAKAEMQVLRIAEGLLYREPAPVE